jgi:nucleotide-binding universal stress UspA family protein
VLRDHTLASVIGAQASDTAQRVAAGAHSVLSWVAELAAGRGVPATVVARDGEPSRRILEEAEAWGAELIVMGRSDRRGPSSPYLGSETAHVLEFSERPVLVIPRADEHGRAQRP